MGCAAHPGNNPRMCDGFPKAGPFAHESTGITVADPSSLICERTFSRRTRCHFQAAPASLIIASENALEIESAILRRNTRYAAVAAAQAKDEKIGPAP
jgi:hypothetical protein